MSLSLFFFGTLATCLLWTAACTAAGVRSGRPWLRRLLLVLGLLTPLLSLLPWLAGTSVLAFLAKLEVNWFGPMLTLFLATLVGGSWILKAGTQPHGGGWSTVAASNWPVVRLFAVFLLAKASTAGVLVMLDRAALAKAEQLKTEAAALMTTNLTPAVPDNQNAAGLYTAAFVLLQEDTVLGQTDSPLAAVSTVDPASQSVSDLLNRHAPTLTLLRAAAARDSCRFTRDWTRPSFEMLLPELQQLRQAARLLQLAARWEAAKGDVNAAVRDVCLLAKIGRHASGEPLLISGLVGIAIDSMALETLSDILPQLTAADYPLLNEPQLRDLLALSPSLNRQFFGEEAFGLRAFASLADASLGAETLQLIESLGNQASVQFSPVRTSPAMVFYRIFLFPADLAGYRYAMRTQQQLAVREVPYPEEKAAIAALEARFSEKRPGILSSVILPTLSGAMQAEARSRARHRAAQVAVAATRMRLKHGSLPETLGAMVPDQEPAEPLDLFTAGQPLQYRKTDDVLLIYSVGPNGVDDGGPLAPEVADEQSNDDVGLRLSIR